MIKSEEIDYVIVQSGGKGTRMGHYAANRPKCLIPVNDVPMIVNTMRMYENKKIIIIGDHLIDVLNNYLLTFCKNYDYNIVNTTEKGTSAGLKDAIKFIPDNTPFILTWSDLFFEKEQKFTFDNELLVGLSNDFKCRWKYQNKFINEPSTTCGVSGFFVFKNKSKFNNINTEKSLVRGFLTDNYTSKDISTFYNHDCFEVGEKDKYEELILKKVNHRYFNKVEIIENKVYKKCIDPKYEQVHQREKNWYDFVNGKFDRIPQIYSTNPLILEKVNGKHLWDINENKEKIIESYCEALNSLHNIGKIKGSPSECMGVYFSKVHQRVSEVEKIIPFIDKPHIKINGKNCQNPLYDLSYFENVVSSLINIEDYTVIHGDCTFSNTLVDENYQIWFIDPRGSFANTEIYGDKRYDWAKLYYSAFGNYDSINFKKFKVKMVENEVDLEIMSNGYEQYGDLIIERSGMSVQEMKVIHCSIWLSLTGYVKEDIDAVLYAFYRGCELWTQLNCLL
jgi:GTP:adenosylcobinamide-phosphate guanylyltransferase/thiamine kinase-like enzyme